MLGTRYPRVGRAVALASLAAVLCATACTPSPSPRPQRSGSGSAAPASSAAYDYSLTFRKRFFHHFNAFKVIKYLNFVHTNGFHLDTIGRAWEKSRDLL